MDPVEKKEGKNVKIITVIAAGIILVAVYFLIIGALVSLSPSLSGKTSQGRAVQKTIGVFPYPVALVGSSFIDNKQLFSELNSVRKFYESQDFSKLGMRVDFSTDDGKKRLEIKGREILGKLVDDAIIQAEAKKVGINLTSDDVNQAVDRKIKEYGAGDFLKNNLEKLYGWNLDDFKQNIVKPDLYREGMMTYIQKNDPSYVTAKSKIDQAQKDLQGGMNFSDAVKKYSDGESVASDGALGWFSADQMLPEVAMAVFKLDAGKQSEIIQSSVGYHIVRVEDKKTENDVSMVKVSQIFARTQSFSDWLKTAEKKYRIFLFSREFKWNADSQAVEFRSVEMQNYEKNIKNNATDDPSMIF